jgi:exonuclease III
MNTLRIMSWNANGLARHKLELQVVLDLNSIDICLISETHFTNQSYINFKGYVVYHTPHPDNSARGGSAIIVKESFKHFEETKFSTREIQATLIMVHTQSYPLLVAGLYSPPRHIIKKKFYSELFKTLGNRFIVGGDWNAKHKYWGSRLTTTKGRELFSSITDNYCEALSTAPKRKVGKTEL